MAVEFAAERCKGCGLCIIFCPKGIIVPDERINESGFHPATVVATDQCTACGICALMCPDLVIRIWKETGDGEEGVARG